MFIHGLGDTADLWQGLIGRLPDDVNYVAVDLLGFGESPKPEWARYDAKMQARSVLRTCYGLGIFGPVVIVGHSLGALVGVEFARRYPFAVRELVLCSPPIYDKSVGHKTKMLQQDALHRLYADAAKRPKLVMSAYALGKRLKVINQSLQVTPETLPAFLASLQSSIVNQDTLKRLNKLKVPITVIDGRFDVLTVNPLLREIVAGRPNMRMVTINASHAMNGLYERQLAKVLGFSEK